MRLIMGHSDRITRPIDVLYANLLGYRSISSSNLKSRSRSVNHLPLGVTNYTNESPHHAIFGNNQHFIEASKSVKFPKKYDGNIFANFSVYTNAKVRNYCARQIVKGGHVLERSTFTNTGRISYLANLRKYSFVACPEGNGPDTHRLWETLYMGGTPIVTKNSAIEPLVRDLPVLVIEDWKEIQDRAFMEQAWFQIRNMKLNYEKLHISYWLNEICDLT